MRVRATAGGYGGRCLASRMREVSTTPRASKYFRWITLLSHVAAAAVPHAADAATPRATRDAGRAARDERRDSMTALLLMGAAAAQRALQTGRQTDEKRTASRGRPESCSQRTRDTESETRWALGARGHVCVHLGSVGSGVGCEFNLTTPYEVRRPYVRERVPYGRTVATARRHARSVSSR